jgi:hypothetical protein
MTTATRTAHVSATSGDARRLPPLAIADLVLAVALFAAAILNPFELSTTARWALAAVGDVALLLAVVSVVRARRIGRGLDRR